MPGISGFGKREHPETLDPRHLRLCLGTTFQVISHYRRPPMRVLAITNDYWHPGAVVHAGLEPLRAKGFEFDWIDDAADWSAEKMAGLSGCHPE